MAKRTNEHILPPVRPNVGIGVWYRQQLEQLVDEMNASVQYWVKSSYRNNEPAILAADELPAQALWKSMRALRKRWQKNFDEAAPKLAKHFTMKVENRSKAHLAQLLRDAGMSVQFKMTRPQADGIRANIHENVSLIRSIPQKYFTQVEGMVMRSVQAGGDMYTLSQSLQSEFGKTKKRAKLIARDQNNKATAFLTRTRQTEMGIGEAIWLHSHGGKVPRPTHLAKNGKRYDIKKGWYDPDADGKGKGRHIFPGELINCRCVFALGHSGVHVSILTLAPDVYGTRFMAVGTSLGFTEEEAYRFVNRCKPLTHEELARIRRALEHGFYELVHAEVKGQA